MTDGETELDIDGIARLALRWRLPRPGQVDRPAREAYKYYYRLRYPLDTAQGGRPKRLSPLHGRLEEPARCSASKNGWERADYLAPGRPWRRAGADQRGYGWTRPPWFDAGGRGASPPSGSGWR